MAIFKSITLNSKLENKQALSKQLYDSLVQNRNPYKVKPEIFFFNIYFKLHDVAFKEYFDMVLLDHHLPVEFIFNKDYKNLSLLIVHVYVTIMTSEAVLLDPLRELIRRSDSFDDFYVPTMPEDEDYDAFHAVLEKDKVQLYECPNGHSYTVGECSKPMQQSKCPTCGSNIGGLCHKVEAGNKIIDNYEDKSCTGFCLPDAFNRLRKAESVRSMSPLETTIFRILINCCYYINSILNNSVKAKTYSEHIIHDALVLSDCLQHSIDESILVVHHLLSQLTSINGFSAVDLTFKTKASRREYEDAFCAVYLRQIIGDNSQAIIENMNEKIQAETKDPGVLQRIAYEKLTPTVGENSIKCLVQEQSWLYRVHISVDHMVNIVYGTQKNNPKLILLNAFIKQMHKLESIKYLPRIIQMVNLLYRVFYRQIDSQTADKMLVNDLLHSDVINLSEASRNVIKDGCTALLSAWKNFKYFINVKKYERIYGFVGTWNVNEPVLNSENKIAEIPLSYLLPNDTKGGRYIYALISDLTTLQNEFLRFYINRKTERLDERNKLNSNSSESVSDSNVAKLTLKKIELTEVKPNDCIKFTIDIDILRIVHMHSNYSLGLSNTLNIEYNFEKIQSLIEERILNDKAWINNDVSSKVEINIFLILLNVFFFCVCLEYSSI